MNTSDLTTEQRNPNSYMIDTKSTEEILTIINSEDHLVPEAVAAAIPEITRLVDDVVDAFRRGGRLFYIGAGTSGRLGVLDASECPPTFGVAPSLVQGIIAGGQKALTTSVEWVEDNGQAGIDALKERDFSSDDVLVGITASGQAPFVKAAMGFAQSMGAVVGAIACNEESEIYSVADHRIHLQVGPEILTGSTRMKSGTAQKLVLNMITTASMIKWGRVYNNYMVDLTPVNSKLQKRAKRLVSEISGCPEERAEAILLETGYDVKPSILMGMEDIPYELAKRLLEEADGNLHHAATLAEARS